MAPTPAHPAGGPAPLSLVMGNETHSLGEAGPVRDFLAYAAGQKAGPRAECRFPCLGQELGTGELPAGHVSDALSELDQIARLLPGPTPRTSDGRDLLGILRKVLKAAEEEGFAVLLV